MSARKQHRRDRGERVVQGLIIALCYLLGVLLLVTCHAAPPDSGAGPGPAAGRAAPSGHATAPLPSSLPARDQAGTGPHTLPGTALDVAGAPVAGAVVTAELEIGPGMEVAGPKAETSLHVRNAGGRGGTNAPGAAPSIQVHVPGDLEPGARPAVDDLVRELSLLSDQLVGMAELPAPPCVPGAVHIAVLGHGRDEQGRLVAPDLEPQAYAISETRCADDGRRIVLRGGSLLSGQWALYDLLMRLGVRYFHPEQTLYPERLSWPAEAMDVVARPAFRSRSLHVRRAHPVELSPPRDASALGIDMAAYQRRWIDWNIKMRQTAVDGWIARLVGNYAYERGFPRHTGFDVLRSQRGGRPIIDPDDPRPESEQIVEAIDVAMAPQDGQPAPSRFRFSPSVFPVANEEHTVNRLTLITEHLSASYPEVDIYTINHGIWQEPGDVYGVRFFDLPQLAPRALGVQVHPFMFYDLERPAAGVYDNQDYRHMREWLMAQQGVRRIEHAPEASQGMTFDLSVPLYLAPVTLEARQHDIDLLAPFLAADDAATTGVHGHRLFSSGQEWGYWLIDYCVAQMTWSLGMTHEACLRDFTDQLAGGGEIFAVLEEVTARQVDDLRDPALVRFLVGSDDETETQAQEGIVEHPLPPRPGAVLVGDDAAAAAQRSLAPLRAMAEDYHAWANRVEAVLSLQGPAQAPWVREIRDGLRVFALRAEHAVAVYETALALRAALAARDMIAVAAARPGLDRARAITEQARAVVYGRELDYRYPDQLAIAGDERGTEGAIENDTIYPFRVLSRTHRMFYWERPDEQLATLFGEGVEAVEGLEVSARIVKQGTPVKVRWLTSDLLGLEMRWGDNEVAGVLEPHLYGAQGVYRWLLKAALPTGVVQHEDDAVVVARRMVFAQGSLQMVMPAVPKIVDSLLPGFVVGLGNDEAADFMALGRIDGKASVATRGAIWRRDRVDLASVPEDFELRLDDIGALTVYGARFTIEEGASLDDRRLIFEGELATKEILDILMNEVDGFELNDATILVAGFLGYTPDTLPKHVAFRVAAQGSEE